VKEQFHEQDAVVPGVNQSTLEFGSLKTKSFDPISLWERVGGDMELLRDLVAIFSEECPGMLACIETAVAENNATALQRASHKVKGSVLQFSASDAAATAGQLEDMGRTNSLADAAQVLEALKAEVALLMETLNLMVYRGAPQ